MVKLETSNNVKLPVYYNGGCAFRNANNISEVDILARYGDLEDKPAAVINIPVGEGKVVLSGVHFEIGAEGARKEGTPLKVVDTLSTSIDARKTFANMILGIITG